MLSERISNIFQPMISQQICPNQVLSAKFSEPNLFNQSFSTKNVSKSNSQQIFLNNFSQQFLNIFSTKFSQQKFLNKIFSTFSQHFLNIFSTKFVEKMLRKCPFLQKEAFSQHFLNKFSQHFLNIFSTFSQQIFLNKLFSTKFSQHFLNIFSTKLPVFGSHKWSCRVGKAERGKEEELIIKMDGEGGRKEKQT